MLKIINALDLTDGPEEYIRYYHGKWGHEVGYPFVADVIQHSRNNSKGLPRFYALLKDEKIIGCFGLVMNDLVSRNDLFPWLVGVFIEETERENGYAGRLLEHGEKEAKKIGYDKLYLKTNHDGFYEKYGWERTEDGYQVNGETIRIYMKNI